MMKFIADCVGTLLQPSTWMRNYSFHADWDRELNLLLDQHKFEFVNQFTAHLGNKLIWVANHPYASFRPCVGAFGLRRMPSRATVRRAMTRLRADLPPHLFDQIDL